MEAFAQVKSFARIASHSRVQFRSFVLNPQHFVDQAFKFTTALKFLIELSGVKSCTSLKCFPIKECLCSSTR